MTRVGILSDTHGSVEPRILNFFSACDILLHAGDIGNIATANELTAFKPMIAVHGNIDGWDIRPIYPEIQRFNIEDVDILMTHIGGYPGRYAPKVVPLLRSEPPQLFIAGHSHILKVLFDKTYNLLHINPGAAGNSGIHQVKTAVRLVIEGHDIRNPEVFEMER